LDKFIRVDYQKRSFGDHQRIDWDVACNEKLSRDSLAVDINVGTIQACEMLKTLCWNETTDFLMYLPDYAFQIGFIAFAVPPRKALPCPGVRYRQHRRAAEEGIDRVYR
jgi:hypothetical protein